MKYLAVLAFALSTFGCQSLGERDAGGRISDYAARADAATSKVHISGQCLSACTMKLGSAQGVCVEPDAVLGFHSAFHPGMADANPWRALSPEGNAVLMRYYSKFPRLAARVAPALETLTITLIYAPELIALGVPSC